MKFKKYINNWLKVVNLEAEQKIELSNKEIMHLCVEFKEVCNKFIQLKKESSDVSIVYENGIRRMVSKSANVQLSEHSNINKKGLQILYRIGNQAKVVIDSVIDQDNYQLQLSSHFQTKGITWTADRVNLENNSNLEKI